MKATHVKLYTLAALNEIFERLKKNIALFQSQNRTMFLFFFANPDNLFVRYSTGQDSTKTYQLERCLRMIILTLFSIQSVIKHQLCIIKVCLLFFATYWPIQKMLNYTSQPLGIPLLRPRRQSISFKQFQTNMISDMIVNAALRLLVRLL